MIIKVRKLWYKILIYIFRVYLFVVGFFEDVEILRRVGIFVVDRIFVINYFIAFVCLIFRICVLEVIDFVCIIIFMYIWFSIIFIYFSLKKKINLI